MSNYPLFYCITAAKGSSSPRQDYDSDWILATLCNKPPYCDFLHGLGETPVIVDVQINNQSIVYHAIGMSIILIYVYMYSLVLVIVCESKYRRGFTISSVNLNYMKYDMYLIHPHQPLTIH